MLKKREKNVDFSPFILCFFLLSLKKKIIKKKNISLLIQIGKKKKEK